MRAKLGFIFYLAACGLGFAGCTSLDVIQPSTLSAYLPFPPGGVQPPEQTSTAIDYPVFYATNRAVIPGETSRKIPYQDKRDSVLHYGLITVHVPKRHRPGSLGSASNPDDPNLELTTVSILDKHDFDDAVEKALNVAATFDGIVLYIHGYNDTFEYTAERAAQLGVDLAIPPGHMFLFNWPSAGTTTHGYFMDEATIDASEPFLYDYLSDIWSLAQGKMIHVIAHSMGNRALLRVVHALWLAQKNSGIRFGQIILAAPDVDDEVFQELATSYPAMSDQTTVYISPFDKAVHASDALHDYGRIGCANRPYFRIEHVDTVVSNLDVDFIGHGYFAEAEPFLADMKSLMFYGRSSRNQVPWHRDPTNTFWEVGNPPALDIVDQWGCQILPIPFAVR